MALKYGVILISAIISNLLVYAQLPVFKIELNEYTCDQAEFNIDSVLVEVDKGVDDPLLLACYYHQIAVYYYTKDSYEWSLKFNEKAIDIRSKYSDGLLWKSQTNAALCYYNLNNFKTAFEYLENAYKIYNKKKPNKEFVILKYLAKNSLELGDYESAEQYARKGTIIEGLSEIFQVRALNTLAEVLINTNSIEKNQKGIIYSKKAIEINKPFNSGNYLESCNNLATAYKLLGNFEESIKTYKLGLKKIDPQDHENKAVFLNGISTVLTSQKEYRAAIDKLQKSLDSYKKYHKKNYTYDYAASFENLADNHTALQKFNTALIHYQKALINLTNNFRNDTIFQNPNPKDTSLFIYSNPDIIRVLHLKATAAYKYYQQNKNKKYLNLANQTYQTAFNFHDKLQKEISTENSRLFQAKNIVSYIENALKVAYQQQENGQDINKAAFRFMEKNKATVLLQAMNEADALQFANLPDSLVEKEKELKLYITEFTRQLNDAIEDEDSLETRRLEKKLFDEKELYRQLINNLENNHPEYYNLKYQQNQTQLTDIQNQLNDKTAILSYFVGDYSIYTLLIQKENTQLFKTKKPAEWNAVIKDFREAATLSNPEMKAYPYTKKIYNQFVNNAHTLYSWLLKEPLEKLDHITHLKIIPDAALNYIPFELLLTEVNDSEAVNYKNLAYLLKQHSVSYHYSAALMMEQDEKNKTNKLKNKTSYGGYAASYAVEDTIDIDLPKIRQLVSEAASFFKGEAHLGDAATKQNFLKDSSSYQILHFGMHGKLDDQSPLNSHLVFTKDSIPEHSNLYAADLYNIKLQTDLAVLSACNTGSGVLKKGEGVMSLSRAFTYAGCPSLVMSLWSIPESASAKVLKTFFENIKNGDSKDIALQQAKLAYLENALTTESHPINWAGLVATGNTESLHFENDSYRLSVALLLLLGGLFISIRLFTNSII